MTGNTSITLRGRVGTDLRRFDTRNRQVIVRFRLAVSQYRIRDNGTFEDLDAQWYTVRAWDRLAQNALASLAKGDPVIVVGRPTVNAWKDEQGEARGELVITAQSIGHDLNLGHTRFARTGALSSTRPSDEVPDGPTSAGAAPDASASVPGEGSPYEGGAATGGTSGVHLEPADPDLPARQADWAREASGSGDEDESSGIGPDGLVSDDEDSSTGSGGADEERAVHV